MPIDYADLMGPHGRVLEDDYYDGSRFKVALKAAGKLSAKFTNKYNNGRGSSNATEVTLDHSHELANIELKAKGDSISTKLKKTINDDLRTTATLTRNGENLEFEGTVANEGKDHTFNLGFKSRGFEVNADASFNLGPNYSAGFDFSFDPSTN